MPEVHVTWWDTVNQRVRTAALPARAINITGNATSAPSAPAVVAPIVQPPLPAAAPPIPETGTEPTPSRMYLWLAVAFAIVMLGWVTTAIRARYHKRTDNRRPDVHAAESEAHAAFRRACDSREPQRVRTALDHWLTARYAVPLVDATRRFFADPAAHAAVNALNAQLYQRKGAEPFDPAALRRCVDAARRDARAPASNELPALYPSP
jgi:hypothetical protein